MSVFYESNEYELTKEQKAEIINFLDKPNLENIELYGFADTLGNIQANQRISELRVAGVKELILEWYQNVLIITKASGEKQHQGVQFDNQRRVDIVLTYQLEKHEKKIKKIEPIEDVKDSTTKKVQVPDLSQRDVFYETFGSSDRIVIENLLFEPGTTDFLHGNTPNELYYLVDLMDSIQTMKIHIEGHVCCIDDKKLSKERAKTVYFFLRANGIDKSRMTFKGYSNSSPRVKELTKEDEKLNRRVEIVITER
ncbi:OmpA family protein [Parvicella tangerina]|nr:OmpA family protein [Parvicella tangerina]